jgi:hypothetical protein
MESDHSKKRKNKINRNNFTPTTYHNCDVTNQVSNRELLSDEITILFNSIDQNESVKIELEE